MPGRCGTFTVLPLAYVLLSLPNALVLNKTVVKVMKEGFMGVWCVCAWRMRNIQNFQNYTLYSRFCSGTPMYGNRTKSMRISEHQLLIFHMHLQLPKSSILLSREFYRRRENKGKIFAYSVSISAHGIYSIKMIPNAHAKHTVPRYVEWLQCYVCNPLEYTFEWSTTVCWTFIYFSDYNRNWTKERPEQNGKLKNCSA